MDFHGRVLRMGEGGAGDVFSVILSLGEDGVGFIVVYDGFARHTCQDEGRHGWVRDCGNGQNGRVWQEG